jgi:hypothetical protein
MGRSIFLGDRFFSVNEIGWVGLMGGLGFCFCLLVAVASRWVAKAKGGGSRFLGVKRLPKICGRLEKGVTIPGFPAHGSPTRPVGAARGFHCKAGGASGSLFDLFRCGSAIRL